MFGFGNKKKATRQEDLPEEENKTGLLRLRFIGVGESISDPRHFEAAGFVCALFEQ
jgi:signal recognition particle GTPase